MDVPVTTKTIVSGTTGKNVKIGKNGENGCLSRLRQDKSVNIASLPFGIII